MPDAKACLASIARGKNRTLGSQRSLSHESVIVFSAVAAFECAPGVGAPVDFVVADAAEGVMLEDKSPPQEATRIVGVVAR